MNMNDLELIPAVIINANDPDKLGRVQCGALNEMDTSSMEKDLLPWCMPFSMGGAQRYSQPLEKQKCWLLKNKKSPNTYWWIPAPDMIGDTQNIINEKSENNVDVLHLRKSGGTTMMQTADDINGYSMKTSTSHISVGQNGSSDIGAKDAEVRLNNGKIEIEAGSEGLQRTLLGDNVVNLFLDMAAAFEQMGRICINPGSWALSPLGPEFFNLAQKINSVRDSLQSQTVKNN